MKQTPKYVENIFRKTFYNKTNIFLVWFAEGRKMKGKEGVYQKKKKKMKGKMLFYLNSPNKVMSFCKKLWTKLKFYVISGGPGNLHFFMLDFLSISPNLGRRKMWVWMDWSPSIFSFVLSSNSLMPTKLEKMPSHQYFLSLLSLSPHSKQSPLSLSLFELFFVFLENKHTQGRGTRF